MRNLVLLKVIQEGLMQLLNSITSTPNTECLAQPEFSCVYPPAEDSFLFLDALEIDVDFLKNFVKPVLSIEVGSGSGIISTFLSKLIGQTCLYLCVDISFQVREMYLLIL